MIKQTFAMANEAAAFFKMWLRAPRTVGAILPTSATSARKMASVIDKTSGLPVLEIGPGTGAITREILSSAIKESDLFAVELETDFIGILRNEFPGINILQGNAFDLHTALALVGPINFDTIISAMPMFTFPLETRVRFVKQALSYLPPGRPLVLITYGVKPPVPVGLGGYTVERFGIVMRNVPPSRLWIYRAT